MPKVVIAAGHVQPLWAGHPWVFSQAIDRIEGGATAGDVIDVVDPRGRFIGRGLYSPRTAIPVRIYGRRPEVALDSGFFSQRVLDAIDRRRLLGLPSPRTDAYRVVHGEGDGLGGLIVDRFADTLVVQLGTYGIKQREPVLLDTLVRELDARCVVDRTPRRAALKEGFEAGTGIIRGDTHRQDLAFSERGFEFRVPLELGQKTGYYLDQRSLRARVEQLARGRRVLDAYCYLGSFALAAARGGATEILAVDSSAVVLEVAASLAERNGWLELIHYEHSDAIDFMNRAGRGGGFEMVICDPPKLAPSPSRRGAAQSHLRRIAAAACRATRAGGLLVMCSCSAALRMEELIRTLALGGRDVGVEVAILERWFQAPDHPVLAPFPEGLYLSSVIAQVRPAP